MAAESKSAQFQQETNSGHDFGLPVGCLGGEEGHGCGCHPGALPFPGGQGWHSFLIVKAVLHA